MARPARQPARTLVAGNLPCARQPGVNRKQIRAFAELEFIVKAENIVLVGKTGVGKGTKVALTFVLFHPRLCGPLANSLFHHQPDSDARPNSKLEAAYHKADASIRNVIQLLEAA